MAEQTHTEQTHTTHTEQTYEVQGMTCDHCVRAVTAALQGIPGVHAVEVDLPGGAVTVTSEAPLDPDAVRAAVDEAGYELRT